MRWPQPGTALVQPRPFSKAASLEPDAKLPVLSALITPRSGAALGGKPWEQDGKERTFPGHGSGRRSHDLEVFIRAAEWVMEPGLEKWGEEASGDALGSLERRGFKSCLCLQCTHWWRPGPGGLCSSSAPARGHLLAWAQPQILTSDCPIQSL